MPATYRLSAPRRIVNRIVSALLRIGIPLPHTYLLTVKGRRTGTLHTTPVTLVEDESARWLVAPYGDVGWVRNARAAGEVRLGRGRHAEGFRVDEVGAQEAAGVLRRYLGAARVVRPFFDVTPTSSLEAFEAEAPRHPVFRLHPLQTTR